MQQEALIACVDDDRAILEALENFLDASGFGVNGFSSAEEFLTSGQLESTSCLITDVMLGGMSGLQLHDRLATSGLRIPTIIISAFADGQTRTRASIQGRSACSASRWVETI